MISSSIIENGFKSPGDEDIIRLSQGDSILPTQTSLLLLNCYMCRHHLTRNAREDLLRLLQLHLPSESELPGSLYLFHKATSCSNHNNIDLEKIYHHHCPKCYVALTCNTITNCPNSLCDEQISYVSTPTFISLSIADQLKICFQVSACMICHHMHACSIIIDMCIAIVHDVAMYITTCIYRTQILCIY